MRFNHIRSSSMFLVEYSQPIPKKKWIKSGNGAAKKVITSGRVCITRYEVYQANFCRKLRIPMIQMFVGRKKKSRKWEEEEEDLGYCCPITVEKVNMF